MWLVFLENCWRKSFYIWLYFLCSIFLLFSTDASFQFLRRNLEVVFLNDSAMWSGQPAEIKTKNLRNIGLDIKTDLRVWGQRILNNNKEY
jgi:hypothetical protein